MAGLTLRLLPEAAAGGAANMAADETLLQSAVRGMASLRFYQWRPATLSLGYFQPARLRLSAAGQAALPFVRRPSGGATLVHDRELTYALALPAGSPWQPDGPGPRHWLERAHTVIQRALSAFGVRAELVRVAVPAPGPLCFQQLTLGDLVIQGHKVVGSAQRRLRGILLQHGAVLLSRSPACAVLPGLSDMTGVSVTVAALQEAIATEFVAETRWAIEVGAWTVEELERRQVLERAKYSDDTWNLRR